MSIDIPCGINSSINRMKNLFLEIQSLNKSHNYGQLLESDGNFRRFSFIKTHFLYDDGYKNLPIPVFSMVKPTLGVRFILYILLSMGEFDTETDLILHPSLRESLIYAKLIGNSNDEEDLKCILENFLEDT